MLFLLWWKGVNSRALIRSTVVSFHPLLSMRKRNQTHPDCRQHDGANTQHPSHDFRIILTKFTYCFFRNFLLDRCHPSFRKDCWAIRTQLYRNNWRRVYFGAVVRLWLQNPCWLRMCVSGVSARCHRNREYYLYKYDCHSALNDAIKNVFDFSRSALFWF